MATGDRVYIADKPTLDAVRNRVDNAGQLLSHSPIYKNISLNSQLVSGSVVVLNNEIHKLGGATTPRIHQKWNGYSWIDVSTLPYSFSSGSALVYRNEIHILGGSSSLALHYKWDGTSWVSVSSLPYNLLNGCAVEFGGEIHILGSATSPFYASHYRWNGTNWVSAGNLPVNFYVGSAVVYDGFIHILGGIASANAHYRWNGSSWSSLANIPYNFYSGSAVVWNNQIHVLGSIHNDYTRAWYRYDHVMNGWLKLDSLPYEFNQGAACLLEDELHILGSNVAAYRFSHLVKSNYYSDWKDTIECGAEYYLSGGTKIVCDNTKTIIVDSKVTKTSTGYTVNTSGLIAIYYKEKDGKCFNIV